MNIIIFGASGGTGRHVASLALARGHRVTVFGRSADRLASPGPACRRVLGDVRDAEAVSKAIAGQDAVICTLGTPPGDRSGLRGAGTAAIVRGMRVNDVERLVCMSCLGVGDSYEVQDWFTRRVILDLWLWRVVADHAVQEALIAQSDLDWTIVRPPHLTDKDTGSLETRIPADKRPSTMSVGRGDLAGFLVECAERGGEREIFGVCAA